MKEKLNELSKRIDTLLEEQNNLERELESLKSINGRLLTAEEKNRYSIIENKIHNIDLFIDNDLNKKGTLIDTYLEAKELIDKLSAGINNKSLRTRTIKDLMEALKSILSLSDTCSFTNEDIEKLYTERNNEDIFNNYLNMFDNTVNNNLTILIDELNHDFDNLERTNAKAEKNHSSNGKIGKIIGSLVLVAALIFAIKSCDKSKGNELTAKANINDNIEDLTDENVSEIDELITYEDVSKENDVEELTTVEEEPIIVSNDESVNDKEADLVNRANLVAKTNFFEDAYPSDIVEVLRTISDKQMWSTENAGYAQAFNTTFNGIVENYLFDQLSETDINKVEALRYLAKEDSDLDRFLENYATLLQGVLANPSDQTKKDEMMKYITIFATSLNGFTNEPEVLTDDEMFNEHAEVNDFYNWYFAYDSIIKPTYPLFYPKALEEIDGMIVEQLMYMTNEQKDEYMESHGLLEYKDAIYKQIKLYELQYLMESALVNHPLFCEIRNINDAPTLTLGGE